MIELPGLFVVGTDTGVGKTRIASAIARAMTYAGKRVGVLKPVATGATAIDGGWQVDDADRLIEAIGGGVPTAAVCPIAFAEPLAPSVAARRVGRPLAAAEVERRSFAAIERWRAERGAEVMVLEGVGGLLCPIAEGMTVADLAIRLDYPLIVVARRGLGTLNHALLTIEAALRRSLRVAGVVLNGSEPTGNPTAEATNPDELARWIGDIPILADLEYENMLNAETTDPPMSEDARRGVVMDGIDWYNRASRPRLAYPCPEPRSPAMSSSDLLRKRSGEPRSDADFYAELPPLPLTPTPDPESTPSGSGERVLIDPIPSQCFVGRDSEGLEIGSSTFALDAESIAPDPILRALAEAKPAGSAAEPGFGGPLSGESVAPVVVPGGSFEALGALNFDSPAAPRSLPPKAASPPASASGGADEQEEIIYVTGPNWPMLLLGSYASAVTLALIWWVVIPRFRGKADLDGFAPDAPSAIGARKPERSARVVPPVPLNPDRIAGLGQTIRVGSLEFTPIDLTRKDVRLRRVSLRGQREERDGGSDALALRVRLRNTSTDSVFAPIDEAFVRDRDAGVPDSYIELSTTERLYLYPLAVDSEWSIVGQAFPDLRPGEAKETEIVTAADFPSLGPPMTLRLLVRTGPGATEAVGVAIPATP